METWIKLNSQTAGKDKFFRLLQYLSRFLWHTIEGRKNLRDAVLRLKIIENAFSTFRKLLRLGKCFEVLNGALRTMHLPDVVLRATLTLGRIYQAGFLLFDHLMWFCRAGLLDYDKTTINIYCNRFWLGSIILNLIRDAYEVALVVQQCQSVGIRHPVPVMSVMCARNSAINSICSRIPSLQHVILFAQDHRDVMWDCVKNVCDVWIPLTTLGHTNLSAGLIGFLGTVSSVAGLAAVLDPLAKLTPM